MRVFYAENHRKNVSAGVSEGVERSVLPDYNVFIYFIRKQNRNKYECNFFSFLQVEVLKNALTKVQDLMVYYHKAMIFIITTSQFTVLPTMRSDRRLRRP